MKARIYKLLPVAIVAISAGSASAQVNTNFRDSQYVLTFADNMFDSANSNYQVTLAAYWTGSGSTTLDLQPLNTRVLATNFATGADAGIGSGFSQLNATQYDANWDLSTVNSGFVDFSYDASASHNPQVTNDSSISRVANGGNYDLQFHDAGSGLITDTGSAFELDVIINGDWSSSGTGVGQHEFQGINSNWSVTEDFVYDSIDNITIFSATNFNYNLTDSTDLNFVLHGAAVPEPTTLGALAIGGIALLRRRRK